MFEIKHKQENRREKSNFKRKRRMTQNTLKDL